MTNGDWEKFGETIRNTVQQAIDSQDFAKLNQTITDTINQAVDGVAEGVKNASKNISKNAQTYTRERPPRQTHPHRGFQMYGNPPYGPGPYGTPGRTRTQPGWTATQPQAQQRTPQNMAYTRSGTQNIYRSKTAAKVWGYILLAVGGILAVCCGILFVMGVIGTLLDPTELILELMAVFAMLGVPMLAGIAMVVCGAVMVGRIGRYERYVCALGTKEFCNVSEIADKSGKKEKQVVKDLEYMIRKGWFIQGHLDRNKKCLIATHTMYDQYLRLENDKLRAKREEEEKQAQMQADHPYDKLDPKVRKVVEEGDAYILKIRACNDAIPGEEISAKISRIELVVDRIFDRVEQNPETVDDIRRLMDYYLPTTVKLLEAYRDLDSQPVDGENIRSSKAEIEATLDTLNAAFEKLLDDLFQDTAWDVSSDISVLNTMLTQEGLKEEEWRRNKGER